MNITDIDQLSQNIRLYFLLAIFIGLIILWVLLALLKNLVNKQVDKEVEEFTKKAKIPKLFKDRIGINIKWR